MSDRGERSDTSKSDPTLTGVFRKFPESPDSPRRIEDTSDSTDESAMMELTGEIQQIRWNIQQIERKEKGYQMDWTRRTYNRSDTMLQSRIFALVRSFRSFARSPVLSNFHTICNTYFPSCLGLCMCSTYVTM